MELLDVCSTCTSTTLSPCSNQDSSIWVLFRLVLIFQLARSRPNVIVYLFPIVLLASYQLSKMIIKMSPDCQPLSLSWATMCSRSCGLGHPFSERKASPNSRWATTWSFYFHPVISVGFDPTFTPWAHSYCTCLCWERPLLIFSMNVCFH